MARPTPAPPSSALRARISADAENRPGVYRFIGPGGEVLYVGKSVRIRTRLLSYFRTPDSGRAGGKVSELVRLAKEVEWEYVPNEFEALLRELRLIRTFRPRFNVRHRRERRFAWIRISGGAAPRLIATRSPPARAGRLFGPFPAGRSLPETLRDLAYATGVRDCADTVPIRFSDQLDILTPVVGGEPACIRGELGSCPAPCAALCTSAEYRSGVDEACAFLEGRTEAPLLRLSAQMARAAAEREYERAARLRDREAGLRELRDRVQAFERARAQLNFVYRPADPESGAPGERAYLIVSGRVRHTFDAPEAGPSRQLGLPACEPDPIAARLSLTEREELFMVARWFRQNPGELERTEPLSPPRARALG
jgi:excinuclease ABC subunit C